MHCRRLVVFSVIALPALVASVILARSNGAGAGLSGGPEGYWTGGGNCTACHFFDPAFNPGRGRVELLGAPQRYRAGARYDITVRISDSDHVGAGFEISAENIRGHQGVFNIVDETNTRDADQFCPGCYITHTSDGYADSLAQWLASGNSYDYFVQWEAPATAAGAVTFFVAGNAVNDANAIDGDSFYASWATMFLAHPGDGDGDTDADLVDFALLQRCIGATGVNADHPCHGVDFDSDGTVTLADAEAFAAARDTAKGGPVATAPAGYVLADVVRGGLLYDKWWAVNGAAAPAGNHPLYPGGGLQSGASTYRCKECHGWDYKGVSGAYATGSHFTGIKGVWGTIRTPQDLFDLLKADSSEMPAGHNMDAYGMTDADLWDVVKMTLEGTIDTDLYIDAATPDIFVSPFDPVYGGFLYDSICLSCHDDPQNTQIKGTWFNFGTAQDPVYVGTVANDNPWEFLHKIRFGHPGTPMTSLQLLEWSLDDTAAVGAFSVSLPTQ